MKLGEAVKILVSIALAAFMFGGCATTPIRSVDAIRVPNERLFAFQEMTATATAKIVVTRDVGLLGSGCYVGLGINKVHAARLDVGETSNFYVEPGEVLLSLGVDPLGVGLCFSAGNTKVLVTREIYIRSGEEKLYRIVSLPAGTIDIIRSEVE